MSYTALYRKFRPKNFEEVKGQEHITSTLKNQIKAERIGHAYLFCGTRGTGKTSIAKIFARAVNCEHPIDGSPCNECAVCRAINSGASMNVVEIDAASNNGVENIRQIVDEVQYSPTEGKYKVYIIDEVHMLSIGAFNALLKTLEEPPSYVMFILATTEVHKIPITILSRCQRYDFKRISVDTITARLRELCDIEGMQAEDKALRYIARQADGSMRDSLSLLDQCSAFYLGENLTYENVLEVLGAVDTGAFSRMLRAVQSGNVLDCIHQLDELVMLGRDLSQFVVGFIWYLRNLMLITTSDNAEEIIDVSGERLEAMKEEAQNLSVDVIMRYIRIFSELSSQIKYSAQKRVLVEIAIIKLTRPSMEKSYDSLIQRIESLENMISSGAIMAAPAGDGSGGVPVKPAESDDIRMQDEQPVKKLERAVPEEVKAAASNWGQVLKRLDGSDRAYLKNCRISAGEDNKLYLVFTEEINYTRFVDGDKEGSKIEERQQQLKDILGTVTGRDIDVEIKLLEPEEHYSDRFTEVKNMIKMEMEEEDF